MQQTFFNTIRDIANLSGLPESSYPSVFDVPFPRY